MSGPKMAVSVRRRGAVAVSLERPVGTPRVLCSGGGQSRGHPVAPVGTESQLNKTRARRLPRSAS